MDRKEFSYHSILSCIDIDYYYRGEYFRDKKSPGYTGVLLRRKESEARNFLSKLKKKIASNSII